MDKLQTLIGNKNIELVRMELEDTNGISRGTVLDIDYFLKKLDEGIPMSKSIFGFTADGDIAKNCGISEEVGFSNRFIYADIDTFKILPWSENSASVLVDFRSKSDDKNSPLLEVSPRAQCRKQIEKLTKMNMRFYGAFEYEYYLLNEKTKTPAYKDVAYSSTQTYVKSESLVSDLMRNLKGMGIKPETFHIEFAAAQQELTIAPAFGITCADAAFRFRHIVREIAAKHGYIATFLSKPFLNSAGSSGHFNHSLWSADGKTNLFYDPKEANKLSKLAEQWLAGLLLHSKALMALSCPTPNCFERIVPNCFAPCNNTWGFDDRTVTYRVKNYSESQTYIENRMPGAAMNPYLLMAGNVIAGMDGIKRKLKLPFGPGASVRNSRNADGSAGKENLPLSLEEALKCLTDDELFVRELGEEFLKCFKALKKHEISKVENIRKFKNLDNWYREFYCDYV